MSRARSPARWPRSTASRSSAISTCRAASPASASGLYAKNLYNFLEILIDKKTKALAVKWDDEIVKATALTRDGAVVHPSFSRRARRKCVNGTALARRRRIA